jgi:lipopolysaccharide/colanic/teichoic acid biosynthesis glycosyltransferase
MSGVGVVVKRAIDVIFSSMGLLILSPVMAVVAVTIRLTMGRPVLFRQIRPGYRAKPFTLYKFRTMREAYNDVDGLPQSDAVRLTRLGRLLRRASLDELPQLWNVLKGDMSLVGPRPLLMRYLPYYTDRERMRHLVRPGITGLAQVSGRNRLPWNERLELDVRYVEEFCLLLDAKILWKTLWKVLKQSDIIEADQPDLNLKRNVAQLLSE